ncbi:MAG: pilus assembly PilX N-terminal domain-containing protein [Candidatus Riflebacteria bacterium]|nr:pilus assembly PilX N-terminal domain-containing protein [Candidatus Riflebacteria bacterium]
MKKFCLNNRGMILLLALFVLMVLSILTVYFHWFSLQSRFVAHKYFQGDSARQLAESAYDEAFDYFFKATADPLSTAKNWLVDGTSLNFTNLDLNIVIPLTKKYSDRLVRSNLIPEISITAKVIDFRNSNNLKVPVRYYGKEGVGTIEISVEVTLKSRYTGSKESYCNIIRHHDYKVVGITSNPASRQDSYAHNFILDYAFFFRQGFSEFQDKVGLTLNPSNVKIAVVQPVTNAKGKIFFGKTTSSDRAVFLNIAESSNLAGIIPNSPWKEIKRIGRDESLELFPSIKAKVKDDSDAMKALQDLGGVFYGGVFPIIKTPQPDPITQVEKFTFSALWNAAQGMNQNKNPGVDILSDDPKLACDPQYAKSVLEGYIRQRFFYFTAFFLDTTKLDQQIQDQLKGKPMWFPCFTEPLPSTQTSSPDLVAFMTQLVSIYGSRKELFSKFVTDYPLLGGQPFGSPAPEPAFPIPKFIDSTDGKTPISDDSSALQAFNHVNLWARRLLDAGDLEKFGIIDNVNGIINLRGFIWVGCIESDANDKNMVISLGSPDKQYKIRGQGGILTKGASISINGSIVKESPKDLLVVFSRRGNIQINTDQPVNAALIALGGGKSDGGHIVCSKQLNLLGMMAAEWLDSDSWAKGVVHEIKYDEVLQAGDQYCIDLSNAISFQWISESKL